jgi:hypothetical protein
MMVYGHPITCRYTYSVKKKLARLGDLDQDRGLRQQPREPCAPEALGNLGLHLFPDGVHVGQGVAAPIRQPHLSLTPILPHVDLDKPLLLEDAEVSGQRGAVRHRRLGQASDGHRLQDQRLPEDGQLRAPQPEWPQPLIVQLGDGARRLADIEGDAARSLLRQLAHPLLDGVSHRLRHLFTHGSNPRSPLEGICDLCIKSIYTYSLLVQSLFQAPGVEMPARDVRPLPPCEAFMVSARGDAVTCRFGCDRLPYASDVRRECISSVSRRPRAQGHLHNLSQFLAARTARGLNRHALGDRRDVAGEIGRVCIGRQVTVRDRALEALA